MPYLKKDTADEELYEGAYHVLDSLDAMRSCCLLAELTNNAFAEHVPAPEKQLLQLIDAIFDMLWCVITIEKPMREAGGESWQCADDNYPTSASPPAPALARAASRRPRRSRSAPFTSSATWWTS